MRIIFMGTPEFAVPALRALHAAGHEVVCVYTQPPRAAGRGKQLRPTPVQGAAEALGLRLARLGGSRSNVGRSAKKAKPSWGLKAWVTVRLRKTGIPLPGEADIIAPIIPRTLLKTL